MHLGPRLAKPRTRGFPHAARLVESDEEQVRLPPYPAIKPLVPTALHVIRPIGDRAFPDLGEVWRFRDLCFALGRRDVTLRYRQTLLGVVWVVLQPLIAGGLFAVVFGKIAGLKSEGVPYFVFAYAGFIAWGAFQNVLSRSSSALLAQSNLVTKVYFPRLVLPISTLFSSFVDFAVGLGSLGVLLVIFRVNLGWPLLTLPFWVFILHAMGLGLGTLASAFTVRFRDLNYALPILTQLLMYASPVAYSTTVVPIAYRRYFLMNPLSGALDGFRWSVLGTSPPGVTGTLIALVGAVVSVLVGAAIFARYERQLADVI